MKTVFKSDEIAHIWANLGAPFGRSPSNLSFNGDAISSYATVIGRRITHGGKVAYVLDRASFSVTTSGAQRDVASAVNHAKCFHVRCGGLGQSLNFTPVSLAKHYEASAESLAKELPSRYTHKRAEQYSGITAHLESARDVLGYFGYGTARLDKKIAARKAGEATAAETLGEYRAKLETVRLAKEARELTERTARNVAQANEYLAGKMPLKWFDLALYQSALDTLPAELRARFVARVEENNGALAGFWRDGKDISLPHDLPVMLRAESHEPDGVMGEMVTSRGARVPLPDARRTYRFAMLVRAKGWHKNGETHSIGAYHLDAVNEQGVVAGCHRVTWAEIERFAATQGWAK